MKILALSSSLAVLSGICSPPGECDFCTKLYYKIITFSIVMSFVLMESSNILYTGYQMGLGSAGDIGELFLGYLQVLGIISPFLAYLSILYQQKNIRKIFTELQSIFDLCNLKPIKH